MKKFGVMAMWLAGISFLALIPLTSCGQQATESTTTTTIVSYKISGTVLVPASSLTSFNIAAKAQTADDGVSDTPPPSGSKAFAYDPVTNQVLADVPSVEVAANGSYTLECSTAIANGTLTATDEVLVKMEYTSGAQTLLAQSLAAPGTSAEVNAKTTLAWNDVNEEYSEKAGDLPAKATSLPAGKKDETANSMASLYNTNLQLIGTIESGNTPTLTFTNTGKTTAQIEKEMFESNTAKFESEYTAADATYKTNYMSYQSGLRSRAEEIVVSGAYPSGMAMPSNYSGFIIPSGFPFPSAVQFPPYSQTDYFNNVIDSLSGLTGAQFDCPLPADLAGKLPPSAWFMDGASFEGTAWQASGVLPSGMVFGSNFPVSALPSGIYLPPGGITFTDPHVVLPTFVNVSGGFIAPANMELPSGYPITGMFSGASGFVLGKNVVIGSGATIGGAISLEAEFMATNNINFAPGTAIIGGVLKTASGVTISGEVNMTANAMISGEVNMAPGSVMGGVINMASGAHLTGEALMNNVIMTGEVNASGMNMGGTVSFPDNYNISDISFEGEVIITGAVATDDDYVPPSGVVLIDPPQILQDNTEWYNQNQDYLSTTTTTTSTSSTMPMGSSTTITTTSSTTTPTSPSTSMPMGSSTTTTPPDSSTTMPMGTTTTTI